MAQLIVRDLDDGLVLRLKRRAAESGHSAEEEHRRILRRALRNTSLAGHLRTIPEVGQHDDFERLDEIPRDVDL